MCVKTLIEEFEQVFSEDKQFENEEQNVYEIFGKFGLSVLRCEEQSSRAWKTWKPLTSTTFLNEILMEEIQPVVLGNVIDDKQ